MEIQWPLVIFSLLAGCGGALFAFEGVGEFMGIGKKVRFKATIIAIVLLVVGGCASVLHLGQPANIMAAAANIFSFSGISVEVIVLGIDIILAIIYLVVIRGDNDGACKVVGVLGIIGGLLIGFVTGNSYMMESQVMWNTIFLPLAYLGTCVAMGATLYASLVASDKGASAVAVEAKDAPESENVKVEAESADASEDKDAENVNKDEVKESAPETAAAPSDWDKLKNLTLGCAIAGLVLSLAYGIAVGFALDIVAYWLCAIVIGGIATTVCVFMAGKQKSLMYVALVCAVIGALGLRCAMWLAGSGFLEFFQDAAGRIVLGL